MKYLVFVFISLLMSSCSDEHISNPVINPIDKATIGVKSKIVYATLESNQILFIEDFEYNDLGQLQKMIHYSGDREMIYYYEVFNYDDNKNVISKKKYSNNINYPIGFVLLVSTIYSYDGNLLVSEKATYPLANFYEKYNYEYFGGCLIKKIKYRNEELESFIGYEYNHGALQKETRYSKTENKMFTNEYVYEGEQLVEILNYSRSGELQMKTTYNYDTAGKLSLEKLDVIAPYLSTSSHVIRYEY